MAEMEPDEKPGHQLANALLPYMNDFDETALSKLRERLRNHSIDVHRATVDGGLGNGPSITFTKQECGSEGNGPLTAGGACWSTVDEVFMTPGTQDLVDLFGGETLMPGPVAEFVDFLVPGGEERGDLAMTGLCEMDAGLMEKLQHGQDMCDVDHIDASGQDDDLQAFLERLQQDDEGSSSSNAGGGGYWSEATVAIVEEEEADAEEEEEEEEVVPTSPAKRRKRVRPAGCTGTGGVMVPVPVPVERLVGTGTGTGMAMAMAMLSGQFGEGTRYKLSTKALTGIWELSQDVVRPDLADFLGEALPRWRARGGLWHREQLPEPLMLMQMQGSGQAQLFTAYACICKLEARMGDDVVRNRVAVAMLHSAYELACNELHATTRRRTGTGTANSKGRGDASAIIDGILARLHGDWDAAERKVQLRNRFHDKKRYGKRWITLSRTLGDSLLFACSPRIASVVHNTVFTVDMLTALAFCVQHLNPSALRILDVLNKSAPLILYAGQSHKLDPDAILSELRAVMSPDAE